MAPIRLGIFKCHPKSVADIEKFADKAGELFKTIAVSLREAGLDDLRSDSDKLFDEMETRMKTISENGIPSPRTYGVRYKTEGF